VNLRDEGLAKVRFGDKSIELPRNRVVRVTLGAGLVVLGFFGFLPVLGFWMIPLGLLVLSADVPQVRRVNRRLTVRLRGWWTGRKSKDERKAARGAKPADGAG
jgi:hypothetical protein